MRNKWFNKLWLRFKRWFLREVWPRETTRKVALLTILVVAIFLFSAALWSWFSSNRQLTVGFLTALVLVIGLYVAYRQLKLMNENNRLMKTTEQAKLITDMHNYWDSQIMAEGRKAIYETVKENRPRADPKALSKELERCEKQDDFDTRLKLLRVGNFFELMGNIAHDGALDLHIIAGSFRTSIKDYYDVYEPFIKKCREKPEKPKKPQPTVYEYFEWLAKKMQTVKKIRM